MMQRLTGVLLFIICLTTYADKKIELKGSWQVQPAMTVKKQPVNSDWGTWGLRNWRWSRPPKGVPWSKIQTSSVNSIWLKTSFDVPEAWSGSKILLDFMRLEGDSIVFVNGIKIGERLRPYGAINITKAVKTGKNELLMFLTRDYTNISRGAKDDPLRYISRKKMAINRLGLGVTAPVYLIEIPRPAGIADVFVKTSWRKKKICLEVEIDAASKLTGATIDVQIYDQSGKKALSFSGKPDKVSPGISTTEICSVWKNPIPWEMEKGYIYKAVVSLKQDGKILDSYTQKFGFREVWTEGRTVYLNGHPARWRVEWTSFGITENSIPFLKMMGRNFVYIQPNPTAWWRDWPEVPYNEPKLIELLDREGIALSMPAPGCSMIRDALLNNPKAIADYKREVADYVKRYRNHPALIAWSVGMNSFNPRDAIHPETMGQRSDYNHSQAKVINKALDIVKQNDPTRLGYSHADGNLGDIATANCYPNFAPVQEYEDWPSVWAQKGNMPWFACEFAAFYNGSLYKGKQILLTEFAAIYFGEKAFEKEPVKQLEKTMETGLQHRSHGNNLKSILPYAPIFWDLNRIHVVNTDRAWRTWGVQGWHYFNFGIGYGDPPEFKSKRPFNRYACLKQKVTKIPDWVNPQFHTYRKNMQPLLAYIAGYPVHTDKDHSFYSGSQVKKQLAVVWDGPGNRILDATWKLTGNSKTMTQGAYKLELKAGDIKFYPINFKAPEVNKRTEAKLELTIKDNGKIVQTYEFPVQFFPRQKPLSLKKRIVLFDPARQSNWLNKLGPKVVMYEKNMILGKNDILVIGREALKPGSQLPYSVKDLANGLNVIVLEQLPKLWEGIGFKSLETAPRYTFMADKKHPILAGLKPADLLYWRGSPDLLPEFKHARGYDVLRAPKVTNRNTVASCILQIPQVIGFTPVIAGAFALEYSPLLTFKTGKGMIIFSSLDLTGRVGVSPVPTVIASNMLKYADNFDASGHKIYYDGSPEGKKMLESLQCAFTNQLENSVVVDYKTCKLPQAKLNNFLKSGGQCISFDLSPQILSSLGIKTAKQKLYKAPAVDISGITANLLRWRDALEVNTIDGGIFKTEGRRLFVQVTPEMLCNRYLKNQDKRENILLSIAALNRLTATVLTNAGCIPDPELIKRMATLSSGPGYKNLAYWYVLGPFAVTKDAKNKGLDTVYPGEKNAIAGDTNPNLLYKGAGGKMLDFRTTAVAGDDGFINVGKALKATSENSIAYAVKEVNCDNAGYVTLRFGVDYFMKVWVNGKLVHIVNSGHSSPKANRHIVKVHMNKGLNIITLKIRSGSKGFGFWANMSEPSSTAQRDGAASQSKLVDLYDPQTKMRDPYEYHYW